MESKGKPYTADEIVERFKDNAGVLSMFSFMQNVIVQLKRLNRIRTSETYAATLASYMKFREGKDILLCEMDSNSMMFYEAGSRVTVYALIPFPFICAYFVPSIIVPWKWN